MASLLHSRFLLSPPSPSDRLHTSLIIGFTAGALSAALACLLFFTIHQCMFRLRLRLRRHRDPPSSPHVGPSPGILDGIPVEVYRSSEKGGGGGENACCSVCLEDYEGGEEVRVLPRCGHVFHRECIDRWIVTGSRVCPVCRGLVLESPAAEEAEEDDGGGRSDGAVVPLHDIALGRQQQLL